MKDKLQKERQNNGAKFEKMIADILQKSNIWARKLQTGRTGTPFDFLVVTKNGLALSVECKHIKDEKTSLSYSMLTDNEVVGLDYFNQFSKSYLCFGNLNSFKFIEYKYLVDDKKIRLDDTRCLSLGEFVNL